MFPYSDASIMVIFLQRLLSTFFQFDKPGSMAQMNARPTGDQDVWGSNPSGQAKFFRGD